MRALALTSLLFAAAPLAGADAPRNPLPDDYERPACMRAKTCVAFPLTSFLDHAARRGITRLDRAWVTAHWEQMTSALEPSCAKSAACFASPGSTAAFCNDAVLREMRSVCDRFPAGSADRDQCAAFVEAFAHGRDQQSLAWWKETQECIAEAGPQTRRAYAPEVWTEPSVIPIDYDGPITVYALDPKTRIPVHAEVTIGDTRIYSGDAPSGRPTSYYPFTWPVKLARVANADGLRDVVPPTMQVRSEWYEPVTLPLPVEIPVMKVSMTPEADALRPGKNTVTVTAVDAGTGKPVEARVMMGDLTLGDANEPIVIDIPKSRKRPRIWATSLFDRYSDVVVAPARP